MHHPWDWKISKWCHKLSVVSACDIFRKHMCWKWVHPIGDEVKIMPCINISAYYNRLTCGDVLDSCSHKTWKEVQQMSSQSGLLLVQCNPWAFNAMVVVIYSIPGKFIWFLLEMEKGSFKRVPAWNAPFSIIMWCNALALFSRLSLKTTCMWRGTQGGPLPYTYLHLPPIVKKDVHY